MLVGGQRHLAMITPSSAERLTWTSPLQDTLPKILAWRGRRVVVLASGDPMWFGIGPTLSQHVAPEDMIVLPHVGAFTLPPPPLTCPPPPPPPTSLHAPPL